MSGWSHDPMREVRRSADAAHAMQTTLRYEQQDRRCEPDREGRFGRVPPTQDEPVADARTTMEPDGEQERIDAMHYEVDPDAVAQAILTRLIAGRTLPALGDDRGC
jgi:hypothetical protein